MRYGRIKPFTIENGEGVRVSLFVSGCRNRCPGCFQKETWDFGYGLEYTKETEGEIVGLLRHERVDGLTILGGEPFEPENQAECLSLIRRVRAELPEKTVWVYTGCVLERDILRGRCHVEGITEEILRSIDVLVDGPFVEGLRNLSLPYRGSENQRVLRRVDIEALTAAAQSHP